MAKHRPTPDTPPCYAVVIPGLEAVAADEITRDLQGTVKRAGRGIVVFRVPHSKGDSQQFGGRQEECPLFQRVLQLRTTEDIFLLAWGSDKLSYRAEDLEHIRRWTAREVDWSHLLRIHHQVRPRPKGRPSYRLVTQMTGEHAYRRVDAREALARGLAGKLPGSWRHAEENAAVEIWLMIDGATAVCGVRLSDRSMRQRTYKIEHLPASLRPTLAAAMVRLAGAGPNEVVLDPMCGAGTILAEQLERARTFSFPRGGHVCIWGGDIDAAAVRAAGSNLRRLGANLARWWGGEEVPSAKPTVSIARAAGSTVPPVLLARWDAGRLPLSDQSIDRLISNPPFGKQLGRPDEIGPLYGRLLPEYDRVLRSGGRAVLLVSDLAALKRAAGRAGWKLIRELRVRVLGQLAFVTVWRKGS